MSAPIEEDNLEDVPVDEFKGATLRIDPTSAQHSRSVSPSYALATNNEATNSIRDNPTSVFTRPPLTQSNSDPLAEIVSPHSPDSCSNFYSGQGLSRSFFQQPPIGKPRRASCHADNGLDPGIREFFSVREGTLDKALKECRCLLDAEEDGDIKGAWLLTEINHWDIEKERIVLLCDFSLLVIKYDFIALHHVYYSRIQLKLLEKVEHGEVTYPSHSLVPRISGIAGGVVTVIRGVIFNRLSSTLSRISRWKSTPSSDAEEAKETTQEEPRGVQPNLTLSTVTFEPRWRNMPGVRLTWNTKHQISFSQKWNPFCRDIPYTTFTSHPLYWYSGCENKTYDVKNFLQELSTALERLNNLPDFASTCLVVQNQIVIENYVGLASLLHNVSELGFFKLRGKVSF